MVPATNICPLTADLSRPMLLLLWASSSSSWPSDPQPQLVKVIPEAEEI